MQTGQGGSAAQGSVKGIRNKLAPKTLTKSKGVLAEKKQRYENATKS